MSTGWGAGTDLSQAAVLKALPIRRPPYTMPLGRGRHLLFHNWPRGAKWGVRAKLADESYRTASLGPVQGLRGARLGRTYAEALTAAETWLIGVAPLAKAVPVLALTQQLCICAIGETTTVGRALEEYVAWRRVAATPNAFAVAMSLINFHIVPRLASLPVSELTSVEVARLVAAILSTPARKGSQRWVPKRPDEPMDEERLRRRKDTVNHVLALLRAALQLAWENGLIEDQRPVYLIKRLRVPQASRVLHLDRDACRSLLAALDPEMAQLARAALYTGCRFGELAQLRAGDVGRDAEGIFVVSSKGRRTNFVFVPDEGMRFFRTQIAGRAGDALVFTRGDGQAWSRVACHLAFKRGVQVAGLDPAFTFHGLRHTYASQLIEAGANLFTVAAQLGHADPLSVLRTYGHLSPKFREAEIRERFASLV